MTEAYEHDRLLAWENPRTTHLDEVVHYIRLYEGLIGLERCMLTRTPPVTLEQQLGQHEGTLHYWYRRLLELEGVDMDRRHLRVRYRGRAVELTSREFDLLAHLLWHPNQVFTAHQLIEEAWGNNRLSTHELRTYIARLRRKITSLGLPCWIANRPRKGYLLQFTDGVAEGGGAP